MNQVTNSKQVPKMNLKEKWQLSLLQIDEDDMENEDSWKSVGNIKFQPNRGVPDVFGTDGNYYKGKTVDTTADIVVREIDIKNIPLDSIEHDKKATVLFEEEGTTYVLKIRAYQRNADHIYIGYEFFDHTLRKYFELNEQNINEETFKLLVKDVLDAIGFVHSCGVLVNNISPDNIGICKEDRKLKCKIFKLSMTQTSDESTTDYSKDITDVALMLLSLITGVEDFTKDFEEIIRLEDYEKKLNFICDKLNKQFWIQRNSIKLLADLIICMIDVKVPDQTAMKDFKKHPYFYGESEIHEYLKIINSRLDINDKSKNKTVTERRINELNEALSKYVWVQDLDVIVQECVSSGYKDVCNDLVRFVRNKIVHHEDDTDIECNELPDLQVPISNKNKCLKNGRQLREFFEAQGGPVNYFLTKFEDLLYDLFVFFRQYSQHAKFKQFYPKCLIFDDSIDSLNKSIAESKLSIASISSFAPQQKQQNTSHTTLPQQVLKVSSSSVGRNESIRIGVRREEKIKTGLKKRSDKSQKGTSK